MQQSVMSRVAREAIFARLTFCDQVVAKAVEAQTICAHDCLALRNSFALEHGTAIE
jgi:hypothetical protein